MANMVEDESKNTHQENFRFRFSWLDGSSIIPIPLYGMAPSENMAYFCITWLVICVGLAIMDRSLIDIIKFIWYRRSKKCHARLKNNR